ncbi:MAG: UDP-glucose 4-epimerase GalE [Catenulispora sp. 13_1_20CM_3_70_7]|nr:MAG: UDP-glucose 4-epimerase GalE [Catenulispora sp. 13_1_20CM_3_70_7]
MSDPAASEEIRKVLITGGAGFIGSTVASACLDAGLTPVILDNLSTGRREFTAGRIFYEGDIADAALLDRIFADHPDLAVTVHCAALTIVPESVANPIRYYRENVTKTLELIEGLVRNDCRRLVFSSSASVYAAGAGGEAGEVDEDAPIAPSNPYARTKAITEWVLEDVARTGELRAVALRYFNPIGADPEFRTGNPNPEPSHVLGKMITAYQGAEPFHITGVDWPTRDGSAIRDYIHVWDLAEAHVAALRNFDAIVARHIVPETSRSEVPYEVINLGTGDGTTVRELAEAFQDVVPGELDVRTAPRRPGDVIGAYTGTAKARALLGWAPKHTVAEGIRDALIWARTLAGTSAPSRSADTDTDADTDTAAARQDRSRRSDAKAKPPEPVVDVLMPYYGDVGLMQEAVRSVLAQRDPHWRLTVVDDGTETGVPEWFDELIAEHGTDKIHYRRNATNLGVTENFQKCLTLVTCPLVTMIGCDDRMLPNYIGTVRALMKAFPQVSLAQPGVEVIDDEGAVVEPWVDKVKRRVYAPRVQGAAVLGGEELAVSLLRGNWMYFPAICWRSDVITEVGFDPNLRVVQDLALTLEWVRAGAQIVVSDTVCFQYRRHADSVSSERAYTGTRFTEERDFFLDEAAKMDRLGWRRAARAARLHLSSRLHAATLLPGALRRGSGAGARRLAGYAFGPTRRRIG